MSRKELSKTLFNKNHIVIKRINASSKFDNSCYVRRISSAYDQKNDYVTVRKKSKLGFYYFSKEIVNKGALNKEVKEIEINFSNGVSYIITYVSYLNGTSISKELRPWEIADYTSMPEHFIFDLKKTLDNILEEIKENKCAIICYDVRSNYKFLKDMLYTDIFGDKVGIRFQTDEEKILSHGFDLKISFRKRKETNK